MVVGLVGYKRGMTSIFLDGCKVVPITVIEFLDNVVTQVNFFDDFIKVQVSTGNKRNLTRPILGQLKGAVLVKSSGLWCFRYPVSDFFKLIKVGDVLKLDIFSTIKKVDITGFSIGKGFSGVIKRHNFHRQPMSHGNSRSHRAPGSIGQCQTPGKIFKGKKMPGRFGCSRITVKNLSVINLDFSKNIILVKGSVPGFVNSTLIIKQSFQEFFLQQ